MKQNSHQENYLEDITAFKKFCTLFDKEPSSVHAKLRYYDMRAFYYDAIGDTVSYIRYLESSRVLMDKKKTTIDISDIHYNNICLYLIIAYIKIGNYKKAERLLYDIQNTQITNIEYKITFDAMLQHLHLSLYNHTLQRVRLEAYVRMNGKLVASSIKQYNEIRDVNNHRCEFLISLLLLEKHTEALRWILECDNDKTFQTGDTNYQLVLIIEIVLNYILGDWETAQKQAKKHTKNKEYQLLPIFQALAISDKKKQKEALTKEILVIQKTEAKSKTPRTYLLLEYFDVFEWIGSVLK